MKFTVTFLALLSITSWAVLAKRVDELKDKREASYASTSGHSPSGYLSSSGGHSAPIYQASSAYQPASSYQPQQSLSQGDASTISIGAGYSIGGAKPSYSFGGQGLEGLQAGGHGIQLAPITLQPNQGLVGTDLAQIMSQLQHSLNSGALNLQPSNTVAEFHEGQQQAGQAGQALSHGQFNYGSPNLQEYVLAGSVGSAPSYSAGTKGLSSYSSTGPVLFNPSSEAHGNQAALTFAAPSGGHSLGDASSLGGGQSYGGQSYGGLSLGAPGHSAGLSYGGSGLSLGSLGHSLGASGHSLGGLSLGGAGGHSFGGAGLSLGGSGGHSLGSSGGHSLGGSGGHSLGGSGGHSFGGSGHSLGGSGLSFGSSGHGSGHSQGSAGNSLGGYYKALSAGHGHSSGKSAFKPSAFLGASVPSESGHSSLSSSHGASSYPSFGGHGANFGGFGSLSGSSKSISPLYTKSEGHGSDSAAAYSTAGQFASPPGTTYGFPTASYSAGAIQSASSDGPQYYTSSSKFPSSSSFGEGSFSYKSPGSSHSSLSSHSSGPKYSFGGHGSSSGRYASSPKDSHGAYSETSYNTIKYSEELKPRSQ